MITINKKKFRQNFKYMAIIFIVLVLFVIIVSLLGYGGSPNSYSEYDLEENGSYDISKLLINEIANNNDGGYASEEGNSYDWIELYNGTGKDINLKGYTLTDDESKVKWAFEDTTIKSKEYLIIFLAGENKDGLYTNFSLSKSGGEKVILKTPNGKVVDMVETLKTSKNTSMARNLDGAWHIVRQITPGYINTLEGYNEYLKSIEAITSDIIINEVLVRNGGQFKDEFGEYSGYIELKNTTDSKINLKNYSLSNSINEPFKWKLPDISLDANEVIMIYTSGRDIKEETLHTSFKLNSKTGTVVLSKNNTVVGKVEYDNLANGYALNFINGSYQKTSSLSGGYDNTTSGVEEFAKKYQKAPKSLIINEVMSSNYEYLAQNSGNYYDWIELKNNSGEAINLSDYYLTTSLNDTDMFNLPDVTLNPGELYIVMASGDTNLSNNSYIHANFKISNVESVYITSKDKAVDGIFVADLKTGYSYGRQGDYGYIYMDSPSPKNENKSGRYEISYSPVYSLKPGIYNDVEKLSVEISAPGAIYYTLNGDVPTTRSKVYTGPIELTSTTVLRTINVEDGKYISEVAETSYIVNENHTLPVVSITSDSRDFKSVISGWGTSEKEAYAFYFDGDKEFEVPCGIKMFGASARSLPKKSFALKFRKKYGESELHYQVFDNRDNSIYNTLILRSGSQDYNVSMMRDPVLTSIMEETSVDVQAMIPVILYVNGEYYGIYYLDEKIDDDFVAAHYNVPKENTNIIRIDGVVDAGSGKDFNELSNFLKTHDMSKSENYEYVKGKINIDNMIEFWIAETYLTYNDIINCRVFSNPNIDDGRYNYIFYDLDFAMYYPSVNYYTMMTNPGGIGSQNINSTWTYSMFKSPEFRKRFVEILSKQLKEVWNEEKIIAKIDEYYNKLSPEMERNAKKWGFTMQSWEKEVENMRNFARKRKGYLLSQTKSFFKLSDTEMSVFYE